MYDIKKAIYRHDYIIEVEFDNGLKGQVDFREYLKKGHVFNRFNDMDYFKSFYIDDETKVLCWPDGVDIDPDTLYHKATGAPLPAWMEA